MLRWLIHRKLNTEEKKLGQSMDYLRHVVDVSPSAFLRFASILPFANSRKQLPEDVWFVAQLVTLQDEDCGPCLQITVNLAQQSGVDVSLIFMRLLIVPRAICQRSCKVSITSRNLL